ncbi:Nuclear transport factor 2 (NTF-2) [Durusdinium trenchii]|uniref:Nuclear transport factor 2 (NTF-2) n=1 Tax=Durusdinium trenchii TaxID=1381693 RepID=A0ABP0QNH7_9DINO
MALPFQKVQHQIVKCDCQPSVNDGIVIFITGNLLVDDNANPLKCKPQSFRCADGFRVVPGLVQPPTAYF